MIMQPRVSENDVILMLIHLVTLHAFPGCSMFVMLRRTWQLLNCKASADLQPCRTVQRFSRNQHIGRTSRSITAHRLCGMPLGSVTFLTLPFAASNHGSPGSCRT